MDDEAVMLTVQMAEHYMAEIKARSDSPERRLLVVEGTCLYLALTGSLLTVNSSPPCAAAVSKLSETLISGLRGLLRTPDDARASPRTLGLHALVELARADKMPEWGSPFSTERSGDGEETIELPLAA